MIKIFILCFLTATAIDARVVAASRLLMQRNPKPSSQLDFAAINSPFKVQAAWMDFSLNRENFDAESNYETLLTATFTLRAPKNAPADLKSFSERFAEARSNYGSFTLSKEYDSLLNKAQQYFNEGEYITFMEFKYRENIVGAALEHFSDGPTKARAVLSCETQSIIVNYEQVSRNPPIDQFTVGKTSYPGCRIDAKVLETLFQKMGKVIPDTQKVAELAKHLLFVTQLDDKTILKFEGKVGVEGRRLVR
jgi:hypothetical protein